MPVRFRDQLAIVPAGTLQPAGPICYFYSVAVSGLWPFIRLAAHQVRQIPQLYKVPRGTPVIPHQNIYLQIEKI
jgi:hypothetical protein